jgi:uncharacterized membrane protein
MTSPRGASKLKTTLRVVLTIAMVTVGVLHFVFPAPFAHIVPAYLPAPFVLVYLSGVAEIAGGLGLIVERTRRAAGYGLIALYVAVFPANINMAVNDIGLGDQPVSPLLLWLRLPLQAVFIAWAYWYTREP